MTEDTEMLRRIAISNAETANLLLRIASMNAENRRCEIVGQPPSYGESDFLAEANLNYILNLLQV